MNIDLFRTRFITRNDRYARQTRSADGRWEYRPVLKPITDHVLFDHLDGRRTIAAYPSSESSTRWLVIDIDTTDLEELRRVQNRLDELDLPGLVEWSGRKGYHAWTFFTAPIPNRLARRLGRLITTAHEVFPKQDRTTLERPGNLIKLPLGVHRATGERCLLLDPATLEPLPDQWDALAGVPTLTAGEVLSRIPPEQPPRRRPPRQAPGRWRVPPCVERALSAGTVEGRRNRTGFLLASALFQNGLSESQTREALDEWNAHNQPPLVEREVLTIVQSASRGRYTPGCRLLSQELGCTSTDCFSRRAGNGSLPPTISQMKGLALHDKRH